MVTLCVNRPYPTLSDLLKFIREQNGFIRLLVISMERSPKELVESLQETNSQNPVHMNSTDGSILINEIVSDFSQAIHCRKKIKARTTSQSFREYRHL